VRAGERRWAAAVLASGAALSLVYLIGETTSPDIATSASGFGRLAVGGALFVNYLGLPWVRGAPAAGWLIGLVVTGLSMAAVVFKGGRGAPAQERAAVALIVFSLATAMMAGALRTGASAPELVPIRYGAFLIPLHIGLWVLALPYLRKAWTRRPRPMQAVLVAAAGVLLVHQAVMAVYAMRTADSNLRVVADFREGRRTAVMATTIFHDLDKAQDLAAQMRREGLYQRELRPDPPPQPYRTGYLGLID
jgi:hypothetical protein